jgi:hypothetical protein
VGVLVGDGTEVAVGVAVGHIAQLRSAASYTRSPSLSRPMTLAAYCSGNPGAGLQGSVGLLGCAGSGEK